MKRLEVKNELVTESQQSDVDKEIQSEIGHILFIDVVGYSKNPIEEQHELVRQLTNIIRDTKTFRAAAEADRLVRLPTGDGMALVFLTTPAAPAQCSCEISMAVLEARSVALRAGHPTLYIRMGLHSGPVTRISDINDRPNVAGAGINLAQRVMDCGDANHILMSKHMAEDLENYARWRDYLHDLGEYEVKHHVNLGIINFYDEKIGNAELPRKFAVKLFNGLPHTDRLILKALRSAQAEGQLCGAAYASPHEVSSSLSTLVKLELIEKKDFPYSGGLLWTLSDKGRHIVHASES